MKDLNISIAPPIVKCKVCSADTIPHLLNLADEVSRSMKFDIYYCKSCNTYIRNPQQYEIEKYLDNRGYTQLINEQSIKVKRNDFFNYIIDITCKYIIPSTWLDFGCAYGHFIEKIQGLSIQADGVEIYKQTRDCCQKKGLHVFASMNEITADQHYNVISAIDSFYYVSDPLPTLKAFHSHLTDNGILILRIANRNWLIKLFKLLNIQSSNGGMADAFISYSTNSVKKLLQAGGFNILTISYAEKGKHHSLFLYAFYKFTHILSMLTLYKWPITPGIIIVAQKNTGTS